MCSVALIAETMNIIISSKLGSFCEFSRWWQQLEEFDTFLLICSINELWISAAVICAGLSV